MDNKQKILLYLAKNNYKKHSILAVSKMLSIPYTTTLRSIKQLSNLLNTETIGQTTVVSLNKENDLIIAHLAIASEEEKKEYLQTNNLIQLLSNDITTKDVVLLFGSYAKKTQTKKSDIDMLIINKTGEKTMHFHNQELLFDTSIHPMYFSEKEFLGMIKDKEENVGKQALQHNILLNNSLRFWELILRAL